MHTLEVNTSNVPAFLIKLWKLVEDSSCDDLIAWSESGLSFIIKDQARFARELLPLYFKHNNMASFVRQLNMYGFRKVMNYEKSGLKTDNNEMEFQHSFFLKEQIELLELIKRKIPNTRVVAAVEPQSKSNAKDILTDLTTIRDKQENMDNMLIKMKQENELLWKELTNMRQKHKQQEQVIEKVIHFLVQVIRNQPVGVGIQRKMARMLHNSPDSKGSTSQITTLDLLRENPSCIMVNNSNSSGPVIHEVIDQDVEELPIDNLCGTKSPLLSITSLSPTSKSPINESELTSSDCPLESSSPIESDVPLEPLTLLEPLQTRTPVINEEEDSILSVPLEYITATDAEACLDTIPANNVTILQNCLENKAAGITNIIPKVADINEIIKIPSVENKTSITIPTSNTNKIITVPSETAKNSYEKNNSLSLPDLYSNSICLDNLKLQTNNAQSSSNSGLTNPGFDDPLMSSSLNTPQVKLNEDIDLSEFTFRDDKKLLQDSTKDFTPPLNITQREHNYPALNSPNQQKASVKNSLSNHLLIVDEEINRLQGNIATNTWDVDVDKILGLFSSDGEVCNESFVDHLTDDVNIKKEPEDYLENDLVSFTPQLLGVELENFRSPFLEQLDRENTMCDNLLEDFPSKIYSPLEDIEGSEDILQMSKNLDESHKINSPNKRRKNMKIQKGKRRKLK